MALLQLRDLNKHFGGLHVTNSVNLVLEQGEIHCLIGPNGAGKSTLFRLILGEHHPGSGQIWFADEDITALKSFARIRRGLSVKFQVPGVFKGLSVRQNLEIALQSRLHGAALDKEIEGLLAFLNLEAEQAQLAGNLSHGQKQWLEIGMLLIQDPDLLMLDEPVAGMSVSERAKTAELLNRIIKDRSVLVIEHDMKFVEDIAHKVTVLHQGQILSEGTMEHVKNDPKVIEVYLGH